MPIEPVLVRRIPAKFREMLLSGFCAYSSQKTQKSTENFPVLKCHAGAAGQKSMYIPLSLFSFKDQENLLRKRLFCLCIQNKIPQHGLLFFCASVSLEQLRQPVQHPLLQLCRLCVCLFVMYPLLTRTEEVFPKQKDPGRVILSPAKGCRAHQHFRILASHTGQYAEKSLMQRVFFMCIQFCPEGCSLLLCELSGNVVHIQAPDEHIAGRSTSHRRRKTHIAGKLLLLCLSCLVAKYKRPFSPDP